MLERPSTAQLLAADLRREILDGHPAAGERLRERELVERYGVARHTLRAALELEAAHLALERHGGRLPEPVHAALAALEDACAGSQTSWSDVSHAHADLHGAIVAASGSPRIVAAHRALTGELLLFLLQLQPHVEPERLAADHAALVADLEREGAGVLRAHLRESAETLGARVGSVR
jgi:DNA-binding GntR family transcriptional regulator